MSERDANQLAADVRTGLYTTHAVFPGDPALAALDELVGLVGTLQQEHDEARAAHSVWFDLAAERLREREAAEAALAELHESRARDIVAHTQHLEAALAELQQERDALAKIAKEWDNRAANAEQALRETIEATDAILNRAEAAEAALATTRQALTEIANVPHGMATVEGVRRIARRALADTGGDTA